jgi:hypothetical protein
MKIKHVTYAGDYSIQIEFEDGINGIVNLSDLIGAGIFSVLKDPVQFAKVYTTGYSVAWSDDLEIDAANIYSELTGKDPATYFTQTTYATN